MKLKKTDILSNQPYLNPSAGLQHQYSLVGSGVYAFLPGEAVHATDDPAVHRCPVHTADLSPLASIFHLQKAVSDRNPFPVGVCGPDPHILHLHRHTLKTTTQEMFHYSIQFHYFISSFSSDSDLRVL